MDYISQIHQVLENPSALPFLSVLDMQRVYQVGQRFAEVLSDNFDFLLSTVVPCPPPVPTGTPEPPILADEDRINCHPRAIRCLNYIRDLLNYAAGKWDLQYLLEHFEQTSTRLRERLVGSSIGYMSNPGIYVPAPSTGLPHSNGYPRYQLG